MYMRLPSNSNKDRVSDLPNESDLLKLRWGSTKRLRSGEVFDLRWGSIKDRISDLPDPILCHILSFLPTKLTVVTSILSKRWKTIFRYVPSYIMFTPFIKSHHLLSALQCRDTEFPIPLFRLFCNKPEVYNPLIFAATQRGVETLELNMLFSSFEKNFISNILTCKTLTVLKLTNVIIEERHLLQINISSIKTLHLNNFALYTRMINFFLAFPSLEELETNHVHQLMGREVILQKREMNKCLLNLVRANITDIQLIPFLCFSRTLILNVNKVPLISIAQLPVLYNLSRLELLFTFRQTWPQKWEWILRLLQQSHKLQRLIIHEEIQTQNEINDENWEKPQTVPECLSSQLKTCLFRNYGGRSAQLQFAEYVIQNSKVLLTMTIQCSSSINLNTKYQILQKLSLCLRSCKLIFD